MLADRKIYWITARAHKNKCTARMLASARKDHSILLSFVTIIRWRLSTVGRLTQTPCREAGGVRTTIALHCGWMISNMAAEAWLFGEFSYAFFKSMKSYIAFYFT